jgi:acyl carrier protein
MAPLTPDRVLAELQPIFEEALDEPGITVTRESSATNTPHWDSLAYISIIEMVSHHFKVRFTLGELQDLKNVGDLIDLVVAKADRT